MKARDKYTYIWAADYNILPEQREELEKDGGEVILLRAIAKPLLKDLCSITPGTDLRSLAIALVSLCDRSDAVLVQPAGSPAFQNMLGQVNTEAIEYNGRIPIAYVMSAWVSEDIPQPDGSVKKVSVFKHIGFQYV